MPHSAVSPPSTLLSVVRIMYFATYSITPLVFLSFERCNAFSILNLSGSKLTPADNTRTALAAVPRRLEDNADGVLFVNDKCINCAACSHFAPDVFERAPADGHHVVYAQPDPNDSAQLDRARAALSACPVAAIRVENSAKRNHASKAAGGSGDKLSLEDEELAKLLAINPKVNGLELPFPRPLLQGHDTGVSFIGSHNDKSFGATPYLVKGKAHDGRSVSVMIDTPKFSPSSMRTVQSLLDDGNEGSNPGPDYLFLTHVDDTAHHLKWREEFPSLKRIFHSGDLGRHNWLGDMTLEDVEILLFQDDSVQAWNLDGEPLGLSMESLQSSWPDDVAGDFIILHTPGHSPGSISLLYRSPDSGISTLFTGDTYAWSTREGGHMSGFPRYGNNLWQQSKTLNNVIGTTSNIWDVIAPGHGHSKEYLSVPEDKRKKIKMDDISEAVDEVKRYARS